MKITLFVLSSIILVSCMGIKSTSVYDPNASFENYQTFGWMERSDINYQGPSYAYDEERRQNLKQVIQEVLQAKGYIIDQQQPDLLIGFHTIVEEKKLPLSINSELNDPYGQQVTYWEGYEEGAHKFLKGTLVIDMIDAQKGNVLWQSTASRYMSQQPKVSKEEMKAAMEKILMGFPPNKKD